MRALDVCGPGAHVVAVLGMLCTFATFRPAAAQRPVQETLTFDSQARTYRVYTPEWPEAGAAPLLVLLHGSGRDGASLIGPWQDLARREKVVLVAPDSLDRRSWHLVPDGPDFLQQVINAVLASGRIDDRRVYLFGHSAGGHHGIDLALLESTYFAAAAIHAGALTFEPEMKIQQADRKIPIAIWSGVDDRVVPIGAVRETAALLKARGFPAVLHELPRHTHDYYGRANEINTAAWTMLKAHRLDADPKFKRYAFSR